MQRTILQETLARNCGKPIFTIPVLFRLGFWPCDPLGRPSRGRPNTSPTLAPSCFQPGPLGTTQQQNTLLCFRMNPYRSSIPNSWSTGVLDAENKQRSSSDVNCFIIHSMFKQACCYSMFGFKYIQVCSKVCRSSELPSQTAFWITCDFYGSEIDSSARRAVAPSVQLFDLTSQGWKGTLQQKEVGRKWCFNTLNNSSVLMEWCETSFHAKLLDEPGDQVSRTMEIPVRCKW